VRIVDEVIEVRGDCRFLGYYAGGKVDKPFDEDGWFVTRDRGRWVGEQLQILGRIDNMFISGGENVQPEAIESVLIKCSGIEEVIVVPVEDLEFGFLPVAVVKGDWTEEALDKRVRKKLPRFMRPRAYLTWPETLKAKGLKVSRVDVAAYVGGLDMDLCGAQSPLKGDPPTPS
jgi:O-succinylbenzoic acid--CoA ligase